MVNSADPDQLASSDLHCLLKEGMSFSAREGLIAPGLKQVNIILLLLFFFFFHMIFMKLPLKFRFLNFGYLSIWKLMFHSFACWVILHSFLSTVDSFFDFFFQKDLSGIPSKCQTVWIQIRPDILSSLIWIQTVCKGYQQQMPLVGKITWKVH